MAARKTRPEPALGPRLPRWRRRLTVAYRRGTIMSLIEVGTVFAALGIPVASWFFVVHGGTPERLLTPPLVALLLVANLVPWIGIMVLLARRLRANGSAEAAGGACMFASSRPSRRSQRCRRCSW